MYHIRYHFKLLVFGFCLLIFAFCLLVFAFTSMALTPSPRRSSPKVFEGELEDNTYLDSYTCLTEAKCLRYKARCGYPPQLHT